MNEFPENTEKKLEWLNSGRVTTDTVHRRFHKPKDENKWKNNLNHKVEDKEEYYCMECGFQIVSNQGLQSLKEHYDSTVHKQFENCVYCSKPVYFYKYKKKIEIYHSC